MSLFSLSPLAFSLNFDLTDRSFLLLSFLATPVVPQSEMTPDSQPAPQLKKRQLDDDSVEGDDERISPDSDSESNEEVSPDDSGLGLDGQDSSSSLEKRSFGYGRGFGYGGGFPYYGGGRRINKKFRFRNAKVAALAKVEAARRRKALEHAKVRFNTKKFNELKFKNRLHINKDDKAKEVVAKDRKNIDKVKKVGSGFW